MKSLHLIAYLFVLTVLSRPSLAHEISLLHSCVDIVWYEEEDHTADNEKLAKEIQKAIDRLNELKDADKIEILKKIKKHIEDNKKTDPVKNLEDAVKEVVKKGERNDWLDNLVRGWKRSLGVLRDEPDRGWKNLEGNLRVSRLLLEPIIYEAGPLIDPFVHAYLTYEVQPGDGNVYLNARFTDPDNDVTLWLVQNVPLLPYSEAMLVSYVINMEEFSPAYDFLQCEYAIGQWQTEPDFPADGSVSLIPEPTVYNVPSGSNDPALSIGGLPSTPQPIGSGGGADVVRRVRKMENIDLDSSKDPTDLNACGPAAAASSLQWLVGQHKELAGDTTTLRNRLDTLKKYMCRDDAKGVRFDSMVVGKLTMIDKLKLPIKVKYKTKHESGNTKDALKSTKPPHHTADNKGKQDVYPDFEWFKKEMDDGEDVEIHVGWHGPPDKDGKRTRHGGHWVTATGYKDGKDNRGIQVQEDTDQKNAKGLRNEFFKWDTLKGGIPYLKDLKDKDGNIAVVESVVSESYDPTVTFDKPTSSSSYDPVWDDMTLTGKNAKLTESYVIPVESTFPWITVGGGVVGAGVLTYFLVKDENPADCTFSAATQVQASSCGLANGEVFTAVSPADEYSYAWSNGATSVSISNAAAGTYTVTITRVGTTCSKVLTATVIDQNPSITIDATTTAAHCGSVDGTASISVNPAGSYFYVWSNGGSGISQSNLAPGSYSVTVSAGGTCMQVSDLTIGELPPEFDITIQQTPATCGQSDGSAEAIIGPPGNYDFVWSNGMTTPAIIDVPSGNYSVTVTLQGTSCALTSTATVEQLPANFTLTISTTPATCGISDGAASVVVDPPGEYTYQWPNGSTLPQAEGLSPGTYFLTVTDHNGCLSSGSYGITETTADYFSTVTTVPGNCLGGDADILIESFTPGAGPMEITATGPDGVHVFTTVPGNVSCKTVFTVLPGAWHIVIRDMSLNASCVEETDAVVEDITTITAQDDQFETTIDQPVSGNVLNNDNGLHLSVQDHTDPAGGVLVLNQDGSFTFTPPAGATGQFSFQYSVKDTCGNTAVATVTITVNSLDCLFDAAFSINRAHCGLTDGSITTVMVPPGNYTFLWSNGLATQDILDIPAGQYSVTITSIDLNCNKSYIVDVPEELISYVTNVNTLPGNCTGEGEITITLETPGNGPLVLIVTGPDGMTQFSLPEGQHNLSSSMNIPSGDYTITVYDQGAGESCSQSINVTVPDNTPVLDAVDDFYETPFDTPIEGNVLGNDSGLGLALLNITGSGSGFLQYDPDGSFVFIPFSGFTGLAIFEVIITDACGNEATSILEILVQEAICDFTVQFINTNASCGLEDGIASVFVDPPGSYFYSWSTGETGSMINNIPAGFYSVTIEDVNLGCFLEFETEVEENPPAYISNLEVLQPMCPNPGDIRFDLSSPSGGPFELEVILPDGTTVTFTVEEGPVSILELVPISDGTYIINVFDVNAGPSCTESIDVTIMGTSTLQIIVEAIIPPSEPTSMDGAIVVVITIPGTAPYTILLDGVFWGMTTETTFTIEGLAAGDYTVQIRDANGCESNILNVTVPLPGSLGLEVGFGLMTSPVPVAIAELVEGLVPEPVEGTLPTPHSSTNPAQIRSVFDVGFHYRVAGISQLGRVAIYRDVYNRPVYRFSHLVEIGGWSYKGFDFKAHGGMSVDVIHDIPAEEYLTIQGSASKRIGKIMTAHATVSLRGWERIEMPVIEIGVKMPVVGGRTYEFTRDWHGVARQFYKSSE